MLEKLREDLALMSAIICSKKNHPLPLYYINVNVSGMCFLSKVFYKAMQKDILYLCRIWHTYTHVYGVSTFKKNMFCKDVFYSNILQYTKISTIMLSLSTEKRERVYAAMYRDSEV